MLKNIETYIQSFADFLRAVIQKDYSSEWDLGPAASSIAADFHQYNIMLNPQESLIFLIAYLPHIYPNFYDEVIKEAMPQGGDFPEIGGVRGTNHRGLLPTGETAQFILAGNNLNNRLIIKQLLKDGTLVKEFILSLESVKDGEPEMSGRLILNREWINRLVTGTETAPKFGPDFPAKKISTEMTWDDLVLNYHTQNQLNDIMVWVKHNDTLMQDVNMKRKIKPGYKALFHGPSGTGKTLTASLLGRHLGKDVYRVDLSQVVSKYIGETEKNLESIFIKAEKKNWILFFDEADALFSKRTNVQSSHDRYANQEVSYLLQRVEDYNGLVILASNLKSNMDDAFLRRFQAVVHFSIPNPDERLKLWEKAIPASYSLEPGIDLKAIAAKYELSGASILNIIHYAALQAISKSDQYIRLNDIIEAMRKEYRKEERTMN
ncbi:ATPase family protein associated with various cellular activities (AAA) [Mucilaginibacter frigoritolerans]|uniref:ATPase family protein associated with various cellular activities (AAA) n=1 Tax=Mucilaginibacter frigoritolerans TaxID=652788 RepID=A0A562UAK9_9SPHI|nr:ATP-binding protein [Mucilaginibacter frigoritolerans]TWJ02467.1 ATPase family protein associated with various cellular activities (AAA) [Mucilaginibacter frigoritolerans]